MLVRQSNRSQTDHFSPGGASPILRFVIKVAIAIPDSFRPLTLALRVYLYGANAFATIVRTSPRRTWPERCPHSGRCHDTDTDKREDFRASIPAPGSDASK